MATQVFYIKLEAEDCAAQIELNEAPMVASQVDAPTVAYPTVSEWVIDGDNQLAATITELGPSPKLRAALCVGAMGTVPEVDQELLVVELRVPGGEEEAALTASADAPIELEERGALSQPWGQWYWEDSPIFSLDRRATAEILDFLQTLHGQLAAGDTSGLIAASQRKFDEVAPCYDMSVAEAQARIEQGYAHIHGQPGFRLADFEVDDVELKLRCGGRLLEPTTREGAPLIRQARPIDGQSWALPLFLARMHWEVSSELAVLR